MEPTKVIFQISPAAMQKGDTLDEALEDAIHSAYDWISLELTEEEPDFPPVSDVADLGKSEGEIARNIAVNIRLFEGWDE